MNRRVLVIAYHFPPELAAGALRPSYLAKYLPEFGWDVTVLTRSMPERNGVPYRTIEARVLGERFERSVRTALDADVRIGTAPGVSPLRRTLRWLKSVMLFPDRAAGWLPEALSRALRTTQAERYDAVISTANPGSAHVVGGIVARLRDLPWIADYRDPWSGSVYSTSGPIRSALERSLERSLVRRAGAITTILPSIAGHLERLHDRAVTIIPNAADPADWEDLAAITPRQFELCYTGSMYEGRRSPALLFEAIASLRQENHPAAEARINFYGAADHHVSALARDYGIEDTLKLHGAVPRRQALRAQRDASNLLIFLSMDESTSYELTSKIHEYVLARRPILAFGPPTSVVRQYLEQHGLGWFASNVDEAKIALCAAYCRWQSADYDLRLAPGTIFEARDLARSFAAELDALTSTQ